MTQFNPMPPPPPPASFGTAGYALPPAIPTTSKLAVASLVFALFICLVGIGPLLAIGLGVAGLVVISRSNGKTKGSGLAAAGIAIGSLLLLLEGGSVAVFFSVFVPKLNLPAERLEVFLNRVEKEEYVEARAMLSSKAYSSGTRENLAALRQLLKSNYGSVTKVSFDWRARVFRSGLTPPSGGPFSVVAAGQTRGGRSSGMVKGYLPVAIQFGQGGEAFGVIHWHIGGQAGGTQPSGTEMLMIDSFTLIGKNGPWRFPFAATSGPAGADGTGGDSASETESGGAESEESESGK